MSVRRFSSVLSVCLVAAATTVVVAQPKKGGAPAPAKEPAPTGLEPTPEGSAAPADQGSAVQMAEDPPPSDMEGTNENPDAPRDISNQNPTGPVVPQVLKKSGYPTEEVFRPITLPQNMSELSLDLHAAVSPYTGSGVLRARYGITRQVQLGVSYLAGGIYANKDFLPGGMSGTKLHAGKAVGVDLTILVKDWIGIRAGVPVYIDPLAVGLDLGVPLKFVFGDKFAIGGLDDLLSIKLTKFAPTLYQESTNATAAAGTDATGGNNTVQSRGAVRFSLYGIYQKDAKLSLNGRIGVALEDFAATGTQSDAENGGNRTFLRVGVLYATKKFLDIGGSLGFDDMSELGSFGPQVFLNVRI